MYYILLPANRIDRTQNVWNAKQHIKLTIAIILWWWMETIKSSLAFVKWRPFTVIPLVCSFGATFTNLRIYWESAIARVHSDKSYLYQHSGKYAHRCGRLCGCFCAIPQRPHGSKLKFQHEVVQCVNDKER